MKPFLLLQFMNFYFCYQRLKSMTKTRLLFSMLSLAYFCSATYYNDFDGRSIFLSEASPNHIKHMENRPIVIKLQSKPQYQAPSHHYPTYPPPPQYYYPPYYPQQYQQQQQQQQQQNKVRNSHPYIIIVNPTNRNDHDIITTNKNNNNPTTNNNDNNNLASDNNNLDNNNNNNPLNDNTNNIVVTNGTRSINRANRVATNNRGGTLSSIIKVSGTPGRTQVTEYVDDGSDPKIITTEYTGRDLSSFVPSVEVIQLGEDDDEEVYEDEYGRSLQENSKFNANFLKRLSVL